MHGINYILSYRNVLKQVHPVATLRDVLYLIKGWRSIVFQEGRVIVVADAATLDNVLSTIPRISFVSGFEIKILKRKGIRACKKNICFPLVCFIYISLYINLHVRFLFLLAHLLSLALSHSLCLSIILNHACAWHVLFIHQPH